jgi:hypothetical protein
MADYTPVPRNRKNTSSALPQQNSGQGMLSSRESLDLLNSNIQAIYMALNQKHIEQIQYMPIIQFESSMTSTELMDRITIYHLDKILYNENEDSHEKLVSVFSAMHSYVSSVAMIIQSDGTEANLYLCTYANERDGSAGKLLESNIRGQFPGSKLTKVIDTNGSNRKSDLLRSMEITDRKIIHSVSVVPGKRTEEKEQHRDLTSQGFEKLIDSLSGKKYTLMVLSQSIPSSVVEETKIALESLATLISPYKDESVSYALNETASIGYNFSNNFSNAVNESISRSFGTSHTEGISSGTSSTNSSGSSFSFYGCGNNSGKSYTDTTGRNSSDAVTENQATVSGTVLTAGTTTGVNSNETKGLTQTYNVTRENKAITGLIDVINDHLERINTNRIYGMWSCSCYFITEDIETASMSSSTLQSLLASDNTLSVEIFNNQWIKEKESTDKRKTIFEYLRHFQHPHFSSNHIAIPKLEFNAGKFMPVTVKNKDGSEEYVFDTQIVTPALMVSGNELPLIMGLPRKSVPGLTVTEMAEFGRNIPLDWRQKLTRSIRFGKVQHMGSDDISNVVLDVNTFSSHCFITGASGSGKSNATYHILKELCDTGVKFLVIEPTKGEYKSVFGNWQELFPKNKANKVNVFTTNPRQCRMLRINPFEFHARVHIQEHISRIVSTISACWPLEGAMPAFLKKAFEGAYTKCGWDLNHSIQIIKTDKEFPDFRDLEEVMTEIIEKTNYSAEVKGNYQGALLTRISAMTNGFEGQIFCGNRGVSDKTLFDENCIIDLSNIGSQETRALIMGLLIIRLKEYRYATARDANANTKHITVLEEAHNILKRCSHDQGGAENSSILSSSIEMLTSSIAEMRTYGEGFLIVDQSPSAVDITAIKNTAIKIVMRLPEEQDCKEIGSALTLAEEQVRELSRLDTGVAAIFHAGWNETVLAKCSEFNPIINEKTKQRKYSQKSVKTVDHTELIEMRGYIVSKLYEAWLNKQLNSDFKDEILELIQDKCYSHYKSLTDGKIDEITEIVSGFFAVNLTELKTADSFSTKRLLFTFFADFLQMRDLFAIISLEKDSADNAATYMPWFNSFKTAFTQYCILPPSKDELPKTPPTQSKKFINICSNIMYAYGKSVEKIHPEYIDAWDFLNKQGVFKEAEMCLK